MRIVVAGYGSIGRRHLENLRRILPHSEIAVLRSGASGRDDAIPPGADAVFHDLDRALRFSPEAAVIATPATHHVEVATPLLRAGAHLFVEKPIAADLAQGRALVNEAEFRGRILMVGYNLVFTEAMVALRAAVEAGRAGRILAVRAEVGQYLPDWRPATDYRRGVSARRELGGGVLLELSHELHYLTWIFGKVSSVQALVMNSGRLQIDVEDLALLNLRFESGVVASLHLDFLQRTYARGCRLIGTEGTLAWDAAQSAVRMMPPGDPAGMELHRNPAPDRNGAYIAELDHFFACVRRDETPKVTGADALHVLEVVAAARESSMFGRTVSL